MNLLILLNLAIPFLTLEVTEKDGEKVRINVPKNLVEESIEFAECYDEAWEKDHKKIPRDSILKILKEAQIGDEPVIEITEEEEVVRCWIKDSKDIVKKTGIPKRLIINVESEKEEDNVNVKLPLTLVKVLPFLIPEIGEDAEDAEEVKIFLRKAIKEIQKLEGSFTLVEVNSEKEKVKISVE
jgi:hypothetical protein